MLTDEDKEKIRTEEIFRDEVCNELANNSKKLDVWEFLNSNFGLWILSSLLLTSLTWLYNEWQIKQHEVDANAERIFRLDCEIASRLNRQSTDKASLPKLVLTAPGTDGVFPEFGQRNLKSIAFELTSLLNKTHDPTEHDVDAKFEGIEMLSQLFLESKNLSDADLKLFDEMLQNIRTPRWTGGVHRFVTSDEIEELHKNVEKFVGHKVDLPAK